MLRDGIRKEILFYEKIIEYPCTVVKKIIQVSCLKNSIPNTFKIDRLVLQYNASNIGQPDKCKKWPQAGFAYLQNSVSGMDNVPKMEHTLLLHF